MKFAAFVIAFLTYLFVTPAFAADCAPVKVATSTITMTGNELLIETDGSEKRSVNLPEVISPECLSLSKSEHSNDLVIVEYISDERGTSILVAEKRYAVLSLKKKALAFAPVTLSRKMRSANNERTLELARVAWKTVGKNTFLEKTDIESGKTQKLRP